MKTPLGLLRDGEVFFTHMGVDLEKALVQWRATNGEGAVRLRGEVDHWVAQPELELWRPGSRRPADEAVASEARGGHQDSHRV